MQPLTITRRALIQGATAVLALPSTSSAQSGVFGRIAFIKNGRIMQWSPDGVIELGRDDAAMSPTWQPNTDMLMYVRDGESFSNLITLDTQSGRTRRLTESESQLSRGSADYVVDSIWIVDPFWSESGIVVFASTADSMYGMLQLWIMRYGAGTIFLGPTDGTEFGQIEKITVDAVGRYACYTVTGEDFRSYVAMRDLDTGQTWPVMESAHGAYDGAISPNGQWVVGTIRDSDNHGDLWITSVQTEKTIRLTEGENANATTWDFYGEWVTYLAFVGDGFSLRAFRIDFSNNEPVIDGDIQVLIEKDTIDSTSRLSWNR